MTWQLGLMLLCGLLVVAWVAAEINASESAKRRELRRLRAMELGRMRQRAEQLERSCYYHRDTQQ